MTEINLEGHWMKSWLYILCFVCVILSGGGVIAARSAAESAETYQLSTHILDVNLGRPASGVPIVLFKLSADGESWIKCGAGVTDGNGRIGTFLPMNGSNDGIYKLRFETNAYFSRQGLATIYPYVEVVFEIAGDAHYHIPITMSANGYGTYRGN